MDATVTRAQFPSDPADFDTDPRISYDKSKNTYILEDERGEEWEWLTRASKWAQVADEALIAQQQQAYATKEDDSTVTDRKRKASNDDGNVGGEKAQKKQKPEAPKKERVNTAVYITSLPDDVTTDEIYETFSKFGVIAEGVDDNKPRIKIYQDDQGKPRGEALVVYHRPESVGIAIMMLDETDLRMGKPAITGPMRVAVADQSHKSQKDAPVKTDDAKKKGKGANRDRQKVLHKVDEMNKRLTDWDDDDPQAIPETSNRFDKIVILKHMFTLAELAADPAEELEIKEDVRTECEKFGVVTNVILFDKEEDGVMTVRFEEAISAKACVKVFDGRIFAGRKVEATVATAKYKFKKSKKTDVNEEDEEARLEKYSRDIEKE